MVSAYYVGIGYASKDIFGIKNESKALINQLTNSLFILMKPIQNQIFRKVVTCRSFVLLRFHYQFKTLL